MRPILLGVVGDSAAGKTTFSDGVVRLLGEKNVAVLCTDDYHRYDRAQRRELDITPLHPACNYMDVMAQHLRLLAAGEAVLKPVYDHTGGTFDLPEYVAPRPFMVVEGLLAFASPPMRDCFAVKVYMGPPETLRHHWKIQRDCAKRGYFPEQVRQELVRREQDSADYVRPQRAAADIVIQFAPPDGTLDGAHLDMRMILRPTICHRDITEMVEKAMAEGTTAIRLALGRDEGEPVDILDVSAGISLEESARVENLLWDLMDFGHHLRREDIGRFVEGSRERHSDPLALAQLFIAFHLLNAAAKDGHD